MPGNDLYLWQPKKSDPLIETKSVYEEIEQEAENEYRRLLYVGMTRAADRLIVCGYRKETPPSYPHWYQMIEDGLSAPACDPSLKGRLEPIVSSNGDVNARQWIIDNPNYRSKALKKKTSVATDAKTRMVEWIKPVPPEPAPPRPLSPSGVLSMLNISEEREFPTHADSDFSLNRGNAVHHLLQILPNVKVENREAVADSYFQSSEFSFPSEIQANIKKMIFALLEKPDVKALFSPNSKSEIEISGKVKIGDNLHMVRGKIDRLVIEDETITIADYKTNQYVPNNETDVSTDYLAQLALYRQLVRNLYPHKDIQCFLVWTQDASMMKISDQLLDQQIERIMAHTQQVVSV